MEAALTKEMIMERSIPEPNSGCWIWTRGAGSSGYGHVSSSITAHTASYLVFKGKLPDDQPVVRHTCHNRLCVNPDHLIPGTHKQNTEDGFKSGNMDNSWARHLTNDQIREVIAKYATRHNYPRHTITIKTIAAEYRTTFKVVQKAIAGGYDLTAKGKQDAKSI